MWRYYPDLLATPVPRYTSFPTAAEFGDDVTAGDLISALGAIGQDEPVSLYLHIPYCREICWYCGCNTGAANRTGRVQAYLQRLGEEIDLVARTLGGRGRVQRIAWGGGSPNALPADDFDRLMLRLKRAFGLDDPVVSIELDPRGFDWRWAASLGHNNISRASLGVQTFAPHIQQAIGRVQPVGEIASALAHLRGAGVESVNFDLMYGLPHQTVDDLRETLDRAVAMRPERLAVFGYAHVPHLLPRQRRIDSAALPAAAERYEQAELAYRHLVAAGYQAIGFDHFALPDDEIARAARAGTLRRNFQGFTEDQSNVLIGLGASAISAFPGALLQNEKNAGRYHLRIGNGQLATARGVRRSPVDRLIGVAIEQLLCTGMADLRYLPDLAGIRARLEKFRQAQLIGWSQDRLVLADDALPYARGIAAALDPYRAESQVRFSNAV
ncbi:MAG: oxygen-independent coproporphyrinogen III oxidase [Pseudomonadota bacterium]